MPNENETPQVDSDQTANSLGTVTASIPVTEDRSAHDTLAGHLATAAIMNGSIDGARIDSSVYPGAVQRTAREHVPRRTHITVRWRPYPDAPVRGRLAVGSEPPPTADVSATRWTLDSGVSSTDSAASFESIAVSISRAYVDLLFPPKRTRIALVDSRTAPRAAARYRTAANALDIDIDESLANASTQRSNARLASALADRLESNLEETYATSAEASNEVSVENVELVVRRWEP